MADLPRCPETLRLALGICGFISWWRKRGGWSRSKRETLFALSKAIVLPSLRARMIVYDTYRNTGIFVLIIFVLLGFGVWLRLYINEFET